MNKRKAKSPLTFSKSKTIKLASISIEKTSHIKNEWNRLGDAFCLPTTSSACVDDIESNESFCEEGVDDDDQNTSIEIESINESFNFPESEETDINIEDVNDNALNNAELLSDNFHQSSNTLLDLITSPINSPSNLSAPLRGSDWLKDLPELTAEAFSKGDRKPHKKRNFVKGGFAEQLARQLAEQQSNTSIITPFTNMSIKLKVKNVTITGGLHLLLCSVNEATEFSSISIKEECVLVIRSSTVKELNFNTATILTIQPPWQSFKTKDEKVTYLISPLICSSEQNEDVASKSNKDDKLT